MSGDRIKLAIFSKDTLMPVGVVVAMLVCTISSTYVITSRLFDIEHRIALLERRQITSWTLPEQQVWELRLRLANPQLQVPDSRTIHVEHKEE